MVNETILNYLKNYLGKFTLEQLKGEILSKGYSEEEFNSTLQDFRKMQEVLKRPSMNEEIKVPPKVAEVATKNPPAQPAAVEISKEDQAKKEEVKPAFKKIPSQPIPNKKNKKVKTPKEKKPKKIKDKTKKKAKVWPWILLLIVLGLIGIVLLNYNGTSVFGFNIFRFISF